MINKYQELYANIYPVENAKSRDGIQFEGRCPFHEDHNNSFGYKLDTGVCNCFVGCIQGGAYDYAVKRGMAEKDARKYFVNHNESWTHTPKSLSANPPPPPTKPSISPKELNAIAKGYIQNLRHIKNPPKELIQRLDLIGESGVKDFGIGVDSDKAITIPYFTQNGVVEGIYHHNKVKRPYVEGDGRNRWFPMHKIFDYDRDKYFDVVEGELDAIIGYNFRLQTITSTTGASSIPMKYVDGKQVEDLDVFLHCNRGIRIVKDNDVSGRTGAKKLGDAIIDYLPSMKVIVGEYNHDLPKGYDLMDARIDSPTLDNFWDAIDRGEELKSKKKGLIALQVKDFMKNDYPKTDSVIQNVLYKNHISIIGGDTGCMKSWMAMQVACSVASGIEFLGHFKTTPDKVMLIQFENENTDMQDRFKDMLKYFNEKHGSDDWQKNLLIIPKEDEGELFVNQWNEVDKLLTKHNWKGHTIIIDNLYSSTNLELALGKDMIQLVREMDKVKRKHKSTILLIAHTNKIDHTVKDLRLDQLQGSKILTAQISNVAMLGKSSTSNDIKIMKFVKCRSEENRDLEEIPFKLHWDNDNAIFTKGAIIKDIAIHFLPMKKKWEIELITSVYNSMKVRTWFNRELFREHLPKQYKDKPMNSTKETNLLNRLIRWGYLDKGEHDEYIFNRREIEEIEE